MARKKVQRSEIFPYHVTAQTNNSEWFSVPMQECWSIFEDFLHHVSVAYGARIHLFVLMSNHFHLILSTPDKNLPIIMNRLLTDVANAINDKSQRNHHVFGGPYRSSLIEDAEYYAAAYRYVLLNPVRAKICNRVEEYAYSTLSGKVGLGRLIIPTFERTDLAHFVPTDPLDLITWANRPINPEFQNVIKKSLGRQVFKFNLNIMRMYGLDPTPITNFLRSPT